MTDQAETATQPEGETPEGQQQPEAQTPETGESAEARIARMEAALKKANHEAASSRKKLEAFEKAEQERKQAEMTELEKTQQRAAQLEGELKTLKLAEMQRQAADKAGLPAALASRLQGATLEELELDATALAETLPKPQPKTPPPIPAANPGNAQQGETDAQRRARLYGSTFDPFDPKTAQEHGGGVVFKIKE